MQQDLVQKYIIRQTCLKASVEMFKGQEINDKTTKDLIKLAGKFEQYVFMGDIVTDERMKDLNKIVSDAVAKGDAERKIKEETK